MEKPQNNLKRKELLKREISFIKQNSLNIININQAFSIRYYICLIGITKRRSFVNIKQNRPEFLQGGLTYHLRFLI